MTSPKGTATERSDRAGIQGQVARRRSPSSPEADITQALTERVFRAVEILVHGLERAAEHDCVGDRPDWLEAALAHPKEPNHLYQGVLTAVLRTLFLLTAEAQVLAPVDQSAYGQTLSVSRLYAELDADADRESLTERFGAYERLLALFRATYHGARDGELDLPARRGRLFDPAAYPFLEGGLPGAAAPGRSPSIADDTVYRALRRLLVVRGQPLNYADLNVEQIGSVYESLMGYRTQRVDSPAVRLGRYGVWVGTAQLTGMPAAGRDRLLRGRCGLSRVAVGKVAAALAEAGAGAGDLNAAVSADQAALADALLALAPGHKAERARHRVDAGRLVLQPGDQRRRTGTHYTPRALTELVVRRTLAPLLASLGPTDGDRARTAEQILELRICDPAMGSGAFLVAACRYLADEVMQAWSRTGQLAKVAQERGDPLRRARALVAQRCLYGVDKNPAAVELARLSLWLVIADDRLPFTFVDHALRHGDSLVGLDIDQITRFHWRPGPPLAGCASLVRDALERAVVHRERVRSLTERPEPADIGDRAGLLAGCERALARARLVADACLGAFFAEGQNHAQETERARRRALVEAYLSGDDDARAALESLAQKARLRHAPFHWELEFPEVFQRAGRAPGMDACIGNPPFMGGKRISEKYGPAYSNWLRLRPHSSKNSDLSGHFFRKAAELSGDHGTIGFIATNTIAQGDTRATGLKPLLAGGFRVFDATTSMPWPGAASVTVSLVHLAIGEPARLATSLLDGRVAACIDSRLRPAKEREDARALRANRGGAYQGMIVRGVGFILSPEERDESLAQEASNNQRIKPYIGGAEINTSPVQAFSRYVIDFGLCSHDEATAWPGLLALVRDRVRPARMKTRDAREYPWWRFWCPRPGLRRALASLPRCLVAARVSKHLMFSFQPSERVFSEQLYVFPSPEDTAFGILQSRVHTAWAWLLSSSMKTDLRYSASDCFQTFPFPGHGPGVRIDSVDAVARALYGARAAFMIERDVGLTSTYNALKDPRDNHAAVVQLRDLHRELDRVVLEAYGWTDVPVPPFCARAAAEREAIWAFESDVIDRLYRLNAERAADERRASSERS